MLERYALLATLGLLASCHAREGDAIWPANASQAVVADTGGGFAPQAPAGSSCRDAEAGTFTFTVADNKLRWRVCHAPGGAQPYAEVSGDRSLSADEARGLLDALRQVTRTKATGCGADKSVLTLRVTTPTGAHDYLDSFYVCHGSGVYVDGIDEVLGQARRLAR